MSTQYLATDLALVGRSIKHLGVKDVSVAFVDMPHARLAG